MTINSILNSITTSEVRNLLAVILANLPEYWWVIPASTSGKYHPQFALDKGGLKRHSIVVSYFARRNATAMGMNDYWVDVLTAAGLVHDGFKAGENDIPAEQCHTVHEHPVLMAAYLRREFTGNRVAEDMAHVIESHMGKWNTSKYSDAVLPTPQDIPQAVLSGADMAAATPELAMAPGFFD